LLSVIEIVKPFADEIIPLPPRPKALVTYRNKYRPHENFDEVIKSAFEFTNFTGDMAQAAALARGLSTS
jgi:hypothetical protein